MTVNVIDNKCTKLIGTKRYRRGRDGVLWATADLPGCWGGVRESRRHPLRSYVVVVSSRSRCRWCGREMNLTDARSGSHDARWMICDRSNSSCGSSRSAAATDNTACDNWVTFPPTAHSCIPSVVYLGLPAPVTNAARAIKLTIHVKHSWTRLRTVVAKLFFMFVFSTACRQN